jgi:hypothetical protein
MIFLLKHVINYLEDYFLKGINNNTHISEEEYKEQKRKLTDFVERKILNI